ncbi:MAG: glycosyltransferase family 4 protein [Planctomycetota bacterium]
MNAPTVVWQGWPHAPAPRAAIAAARATPGWRLVDEAGAPLPWGVLRHGRELVRVGWQRTLAMALGTLAGWLAPRRSPPQPVAAAAGDGPVVLVLPVLPDLSHTFVYREALALLRQRPDWRIVVLARNDRAPMHDEARRLLDHVAYLPRDGVTRNALRLLRWLGTARGRSLFALYRAEPGGSVRDLLDREALRTPRHPANAFLLADLLAPLRPRHVHVWSATWPANVAMGAAHLLGVPFSISSYVDFEFAYALKLLGPKLQRAKFFRVVTRHCRGQLLAMPEAPPDLANRAPAIYLGLDLERWQDRAPLAGAGVVVSAARLVPKKGLHLMPPALALLQTRGIACRWRVVGDGPELEPLRAQCRRHGVEHIVDFLGPQDNATVRRELLAADAAVLPCVLTPDGERDGIPIFLCEAMALGVPPVTTPVAGIPELVRDGETGFLARPGDVATLADALARALGPRATARAVADRARAEAHARLDVDRLCSALLAEIER